MFTFLVYLSKFNSLIRCLPSMNYAMSAKTSGPIEKSITEAIIETFEPIHYEVINESHMHNVPKDAETHFKVLIVSEKFESLPLIKVFFIKFLMFVEPLDFS